MSKGKAPDYAGPLVEPFAVRQQPSLADPISKWEEMFEQKALDESKKLILLLEHYRIPHDGVNPWLHLCLALARAHVPGFRTTVPKGRKLKWTPMHDAAAKICIDRWITVQRQKHSITAAAIHVAKQQFWKSFLAPSPAPKETLRQAYYRATEDNINFLLALDNKILQDVPANDRIVAIVEDLDPLPENRKKMEK